MSFKKDLKFGKIYEKKALEYLEFDDVEIPQGKFSKYDFKIIKGGNTETYEIKADRCSYYSNNMCIEYEQKKYGKICKTGISLSKADYYMYFVLLPKPGNNWEIREVYKIPKNKLLDYCETAPTRWIAGGFSNCYLVPLNQLQDYKLP